MDGIRFNQLFSAYRQPHTEQKPRLQLPKISENHLPTLDGILEKGQSPESVLESLVTIFHSWGFDSITNWLVEKAKDQYIEQHHLIEDSNEIADLINQMNISDTNEEKTFNWLYALNVEEVKEIKNLVVNAAKLIQDDQVTITSSLEFENFDKEITIQLTEQNNSIDSAQPELLVKNGNISLKIGEKSTPLLSFSDYLRTVPLDKMDLLRIINGIDDQYCERKTELLVEVISSLKGVSSTEEKEELIKTCRNPIYDSNITIQQFILRDIDLLIQNGKRIEPVKIVQNNHLVTSIATAARIVNQGSERALVDAMENNKDHYAIKEEVLCKTPEGLVNVASKVGLQVNDVKCNSVEEYEKHISESIKAGHPIVAPFLVDGDSTLTTVGGIRGHYVYQKENKNWGSPIQLQKTIDGMSEAVATLIVESKSIEDFKKKISERDSRESTSYAHLMDKNTPEERRVEGIEKLRAESDATHTIARYSSLKNVLFKCQTINDLKLFTSEKIRELIYDDLVHSCVITGYNPIAHSVTITHWNTNFETDIAALYASSNLLKNDDPYRGVLITFKGKKESI